MVKVDRYAVVKCEGGYDLYDLLHKKRVYGKAVVKNEGEAIEFCEDFIETTCERKSVWITIN